MPRATSPARFGAPDLRLDLPFSPNPTNYQLIDSSLCPAQGLSAAGGRNDVRLAWGHQLEVALEPPTGRWARSQISQEAVTGLVGSFPKPKQLRLWASPNRLFSSYECPPGFNRPYLCWMQGTLLYMPKPFVSILCVKLKLYGCSYKYPLSPCSLPLHSISLAQNALPTVSPGHVLPLKRLSSYCSKHLSNECTLALNLKPWNVKAERDFKTQSKPYLYKWRTEAHKDCFSQTTQLLSDSLADSSALLNSNVPNTYSTVLDYIGFYMT